VRTVDYSKPIKVTASAPTYSSDVLARAKENELGFDFNATRVFVQIKGQYQINGFINEFKLGQNPSSIQAAAIQADIVSHSMGGNVVRTMALNPSFLSSDTFGKGLVHKHITIGSPHLGTPVARELLNDDQNKCVRDILADKDRDHISFEAVALQGQKVLVSGGVWDLRGDGTLNGNVDSSALNILKQNNDSFPTAPVAGVMGPTQLSALNCTASCVNVIVFGARNCIPAALRCACRGNPLAANLTVAGWPMIVNKFNDANDKFSDAIVPRSSQFKGLSGIQITAVHSSGAVNLGFGGPHEYERASQSVNNVIELLNTPVTRSVVFLRR